MTHDEQAESLEEEARQPQARNDQTVRQIGKQARKRIGTHLRAMYDSVVQQPIPSRFTDLIAQLDDASTEQAAEKY